MSVALHKRNCRLEDVPHISLIGAFAPACLILLVIAILVAVLGHFFPAG